MVLFAIVVGVFLAMFAFGAFVLASEKEYVAVDKDGREYMLVSVDEQYARKKVREIWGFDPVTVFPNTKNHWRNYYDTNSS